jgi:hypothetical protein
VFLDGSTVRKRVKAVGCQGSARIYNEKKVKKMRKNIGSF